MKKSLFLALAIVLTLPARAQDTLNPADTRIHWDCHKVLVKADIPEMLGLALTQGTPKLARVLMGMCSDALTYPFYEQAGPTFTLLGEIYQKVRQPSVTVEDFQPALDAYDPTIYPLAIAMAAKHSPIAGMTELVQELDALGYAQGQATNMSPTEYALIAARHPELFGKFKPGLMVDVSEETPVRKPAAEYFTRLLERHGAKHNIFVDDKLKNTRAAAQAGLTAIQFKDALQLRHELRKLGIPVREEIANSQPLASRPS